MSRREGPQRTTRRRPLTSSTNLLIDATHATVEKVLLCGYYNLLPRLLLQPEPQVQASPDPAAAASVSAKIVGSAGVADSPSGSAASSSPTAAVDSSSRYLQDQVGTNRSTGQLPSAVSISEPGYWW